MQSRYDFGPLTYISAESIGEPGQRRFRLQAISEDGESAAIWLEKQQLSALGEAIEALLKDERQECEPLALDDLQGEPPFPDSPTVELDARAGRLAVGVNRQDGRLVLISNESPEDEEDSEAQLLSLEFDYQLGRILRWRIVDAVAGGRPLCPVCSTPVDPEGHYCPRRNGQPGSAS